MNSQMSTSFNNIVLLDYVHYQTEHVRSFSINMIE
jgi:hypothetical protein